MNPFDVLALARYLRLDTTELAQRSVGADGTLRRDPTTGACAFLGVKGCTVHPARPLACRLYPLGRQANSRGEERFFHIRPHPHTDGLYGDTDTVGDYLQDQDAEEHMVAADRYLALYCRCVAALSTDATIGKDVQDDVLALLDPDAVITRHHPQLDPFELNPEQAMSIHIDTIEAMLSQQTKEIDHESEEL